MIKNLLEKQRTEIKKGIIKYVIVLFAIHDQADIRFGGKYKTNAIMNSIILTLSKKQEKLQNSFNKSHYNSFKKLNFNLFHMIGLSLGCIGGSSTSWSSEYFLISEFIP